MEETIRTSVTLTLTESEKAEFTGMAETVGQSPDKFASDAVLEYMQTLNDNPDRILLLQKGALSARPGWTIGNGNI